MSFRRIFGSPSGQDEDHWLAVSDVMAGLMVVFLFIAINYVLQREGAPMALRERIYESLHKTFENDLERWCAKMEEDTLTVRFKTIRFKTIQCETPQILFEKANPNLGKDFERILNDFCPRYFKELYKLRESIYEIRIEGHASSEWGKVKSKDEAFIKNMYLSQERAHSVFVYCLGLGNRKEIEEWAQTEEWAQIKEWARDYVTANGLSSSRALSKDGKEDRDESRRVEFRVETLKDSRIARIVGGKLQ